MQVIEDPGIAAQLRVKVNSFNLKSAAVVASATLLYVAVPALLQLD